MDGGGQKKAIWVGVTCLVLCIGGVAAWAMWSEPEPEPEPVVDGDTGMTRAETEDLMRTIGYVQ